MTVTDPSGTGRSPRRRMGTEFLEPYATYEYEVLAIEASGNQTITEVEFETE